jgi:hypothetical protein
MTKTLHTLEKSREMTRVIKIILIVVISAVAIVRETAWFVNAQSLPTDPVQTCTVTPALFASWFDSGSVSLNGTVKPANSVTFPGNVANNCNFYRWSEQMFLWLTSPTPPTYGGGGGHIFDSPVFFDVSPPVGGVRTFIPHTPGGMATLSLRAAQVGAHGLPVIMAKGGRMFEVVEPRIAASGKQIILNRSGRSTEIESATLENGKPVLRDKAGKVIPTPKAIIEPRLSQTRTVQRVMIGRTPILLDPLGNVIDTEEGQADGGVLQAQNGSLIYYETTVNDVYAYFLTGAKTLPVNGGINPTPTQFPTTQAELNKVIAFASAHGKTFPDPTALAVEVKSAWIETTGLNNLSSYITKQATVPTYTKTANQWTPTGQMHTVTVALLAMHVVGSTAGHPEMIWATFEHFGNSPNAVYQYNSTSGLKMVPQNTVGSWVFCASGSNGPFNVMHMHTVPFGSSTIVACNASNPCGTVNNQTISPSDTIRFKPFGGASNASPNPLDPTVAASNTEIISINNSVIGHLVSGDIRRNYYMTGSTWTIGGGDITSNFGNPGNPGVTTGKGVGTSQLANTTMETYQQVNTLFGANSNNCFSCHTSFTAPGPVTTAVSHVYPPLKPLF